MIWDLGFIGTILTALFGIASVYFYLKTRRVKLPTFIVSRDVLQAKTHPNVSISFGGQQIESLMRYRIIFYNGGQEEIRSADIPPKHPPSISFDQTIRLFSWQIIGVSRPEIDFHLSSDTNNQITLQFSFLNPGDGAVIEVLCDFPGGWWEAPPPTLQASIIGARPARVLPYRYPPGAFELFEGGFTALFVAGFGVASIALYFLGRSWIVGVVGVLGLAVGSWVAWSTTVKPFTELAPHFARPIWEAHIAELVAGVRKKLGA
jgi:hypothetical protein